MSVELDMLSQEEIEAVAVFLIRELEGRVLEAGIPEDGGKSEDFGGSLEMPWLNQQFSQGEDDEHDGEPETFSPAVKELIREVVRDMYIEKEIIRDTVYEAYAEKENEGFFSGMSSSEMDFLAPFLPQKEGGSDRKRVSKTASAEAATLEERQQALPDYSEIAHESGVDMSRVSRYFDRDSRRYDSAFERY